MSQLNVFYQKHKVGALSRNEDLVYSFLYDPSWLTSEVAFPLSLAMPLQKEPFGNKTTLSFFENLLPEGEVREVIQKEHNSKSTFDFLQKFGHDCAGAIVLTEADFIPDEESNIELEVELKEIFQAIEERRSVAEVISNIDTGYLSIAGAQDKFAAIVREGRVFLPQGGQPSTHIIKVPIYRSGVKQSVYNEYFCMQLAKRVGLETSECFVLDHEKYPLYVTQRYDREIIDGHIHRLHQQDFCQAQGVVSENKYEEKGGPTLIENYNLIKSHVTILHRKSALFDFIDWVIFNLIIGNNDSHAKNLSFLLRKEKIYLAPFYDLLCTAIYPKLKNDFSFLIGGRRDFSQIGVKQFLLLDESLGLKKGTMSERAKYLMEKIISEKTSLGKEMSAKFPHSKIHVRISDLIEKRCRSLQRQGL